MEDKIIVVQRGGEMSKDKLDKKDFPAHRRNQNGDLIIEVSLEEEGGSKVVVSHGTSPRLLKKFWKIGQRHLIW